MCKGIVLIVNKVTKVLSYKNSGTLTFPTCDRFPFIVFSYLLYSLVYLLTKTPKLFIV